MSDEQQDAAAQLMDALIHKMEQMDARINNQNTQLRKLLADPAVLLKRAGFIHHETPRLEDVWSDPLRGNDAIVKGVDGDESFDVPNTNEEFYDMDWNAIHNLAGQAKSLGHVANIPIPTGDAE